MDIHELNKRLQWDDCYNPNFNWDNEEFYMIYVLPEEFINRFKHKINWHLFSTHHTYDENLFNKYQDKIDWNVVEIRLHINNFFMEYLNKKQSVKLTNFLI